MSWVLPKSRWRTVGLICRYILLVLMLGHHRRGLVHEGHHAVPGAKPAVDPVLSAALRPDGLRNALPYALQTSILILFGILFCWVSAGF